MGRVKRYVQVGLGGRHEMFRDAITKTFRKTAELTALCDNNPGRIALSVANAAAAGSRVQGYDAADFDRMIKEQKPDCVIVTTIDRTHDDYICRAMELGCDVITEKPMTIDEKKCRRILDTQKKTGRKCTVTFNYRYSPPRTQVKELLMSGVIGEILSVDFHWMLDLSHGADYFRRWHRNKKNSGGLMVHKATHHFDLVNWWLGTVPETVTALGHRHFYIPGTADRYGLRKRGKRCHTCPSAAKCCFCLKLKDNKNLNELYLQNEKYDGYFRDKCVFSDEIDIEDSMNVIVDYRNGAKMSYSLNAFSPWEGYIISFNGTRGRIEHKCEESVYINADGSIPGALKREGTWTKVYPNGKPAYAVDIWKAEGGHGGADPVMLQHIFDPASCKPDKYLRAADQRSGAWSIIVGVAANQSMKAQKAVSISKLAGRIDLPDYAPMPSGKTPLPKWK